MIAVSKIDDENKFRKDMFKSKRKALDEIWMGESIIGVSNLVRFAPSACNTQPSDNDIQLMVYSIRE